MPKVRQSSDTEICCMCGRSVAEGTPGFEDREREYNSMEDRRKQGCVYPLGEYVCAGCAALRSRWNREE